MFLISTLFMVWLIFFYTYASIIDAAPDTRILEGYYKIDDYGDSHVARDYADFYKYYYTSEDDCKFENDERYEKVKSDDIEKIKSYFPSWIKRSERLKGYVFDEAIVDENDYVLIGYDESSGSYDRYHVFFYDIDSHILYEANVKE